MVSITRMRNPDGAALYGNVLTRDILTDCDRACESESFVLRMEIRKLDVLDGEALTYNRIRLAV